jgi:hypothetical protein
LQRHQGLPAGERAVQAGGPLRGEPEARVEGAVAEDDEAISSGAGWMNLRVIPSEPNR